ncbi:hypothetical protein PghCCS26_46310 [Paenibacillus glycanilyticus]|uniref:Uncharacterized protein n=1 Tax=Paenibacillus glycanilyticus TaxID=126569 RepID=A0ABQ6NQY2_9BACL|nr:hypothetical protein PghCCS26_46310 [Paenibacillus glycanilyticus]
MLFSVMYISPPWEGIVSVSGALFNYILKQPQAPLDPYDNELLSLKEQHI